VAIDSDGKAYASARDQGDGNFQVYNSDGTLAWAKYQEVTEWLCPNIGDNSVIYISVSAAGGGSAIYALDNNRPLASTGWPRTLGGNGNGRNINLR
jgi:hypothetical protein